MTGEGRLHDWLINHERIALSCFGFARVNNQISPLPKVDPGFRRTLNFQPFQNVTTLHPVSSSAQLTFLALSSIILQLSFILLSSCARSSV